MLPKAFGKTSRASKASNASRRCIMCKESQVEANYKDIRTLDSALPSSDRPSAHKVRSHGSSNYVGKLICKALSSPENAMAMISIEESESIWQRRHPVERSRGRIGESDRERRKYGGERGEITEKRKEKASKVKWKRKWTRTLTQWHSYLCSGVWRNGNARRDSGCRFFICLSEDRLWIKSIKRATV